MAALPFFSFGGKSTTGLSATFDVMIVSKGVF
jgi:hypothetical protein